MGEMAPFRLLISREEALKIVLSSVKPIERTEWIPIEESSSRILAEDVVADRDVPPFDRSAVDGYAVKAEETYGASYTDPVTLKIVGVLHAAESTDKTINKIILSFLI